MAALAAVPSFAGSFSAPSTSQSHQSSRQSQMPRNLYSNAVTGYRPNSQPTVAPYAFTSTPNLTPATSQAPSNNSSVPRQETPFSSQPQNTHFNQPSRLRTTQQSSFAAPNSPSPIPTNSVNTSRDDSSLNTRRSSAVGNNGRPASTINLISLVPSGQNAAGKPSPDRYRRNHRRVDTGSSSSSAFSGSAVPSGSGMATVGHLYKHPNRASSSPSLHTLHNSSSPSMLHRSQIAGSNQSPYDQTSRKVSDDMHLQRRSTYDQALNYRRRSVSSLDMVENVPPGRADPSFNNQQPLRPLATQSVEVSKSSQSSQRPLSSHGRQGSGESSVSGRSSHSRPGSVKNQPMTYAAALQSSPVTNQDHKQLSIPPRGSSDVNRRLASPSPLSRPATTEQRPTTPQKSPAPRPKTAEPMTSTPPPARDSPAVQHLAALTERENKKGVKSRLRRAFSFGSAAELRRASAENSMNNSANAERAKLKKDRPQGEEEDAEQDAIAKKQEAGGIGESIYSGQGGFFTGSTDNLSISSTASSASVMIRKMGKGMKKSTRSLVGLFRPKSVYGDVGPEISTPEPSVGQVSMVTVEAEREKVNVNPNPHDQAGGGTGFPHLERNSLDAARATSRDEATLETKGRRTIIGGDKDRAEILSSMKKGILKRTGTDSGNTSPIVRPTDKPIDFNLPQIPHVNDTPGSSAPSTPRDERPPMGHRRTDSVTIEGEDYFANIPKINNGEDSKGFEDPQNQLSKFNGDEAQSFSGSQHTMVKYNVTFSPRLQFHDTWPSLEYDRRGEIATCNRLTPMLAQQIKEELNTFKMEMEVHEQSKVYTHFF